MPRYRANSHEVEGCRIVRVQPLMSANKVLSPDAGLTLVLNDDTKHAWLSEKNAPMPTVGDFLIRDDELNLTYVVGAAKFNQLFEEPKP